MLWTRLQSADKLGLELPEDMSDLVSHYPSSSNGLNTHVNLFYDKPTHAMTYQNNWGLQRRVREMPIAMK